MESDTEKLRFERTLHGLRDGMMLLLSGDKLSHEAFAALHLEIQACGSWTKAKRIARKLDRAWVDKDPEC